MKREADTFPQAKQKQEQPKPTSIATKTPHIQSIKQILTASKKFNSVFQPNAFSHPVGHQAFHQEPATHAQPAPPTVV